MNKRVVGLIFLGLVFISLFSIVSAEAIISKITGDIDLSIITNITGADGNSPVFAKILLFILVALIVYSILKAMPIFKSQTNNFVVILAAVVIGILSIFFLKSEEIYLTLLSYGALGITLSGIIPFVLIAVFTAELTKGGYNLLSKIVWLVFGFVLFLRLILADSAEISELGAWAYLILIILCIIMFIWEKTFVGIFAKDMIRTKIEKYKIEQQLIRARNKQAAKEVEAGGAEEHY